jgi:uncharacterized phage protein (TIGR02216 family)
MAAGLGLLRLSPRTLWSMTPRELVAALSIVLPRAALTPPTPAGLDALLRRLPDHPVPKQRLGTISHDRI